MSEPYSTNAAEQAGASIGRYKLLEQIGEGGMGTIWMAEQREPVKRRVALKIIKLGMDTKQVIARFEAERQALALMDHPNIAKVLDAGATETGRPYFVMEYIKGIPILEYCDQEKVDTRGRLELFTRVCHAIQHAHQKGIIHRDIKPSNVLVTLHDGVPVPKVIDFGIAKATSSELTTRTLFTEHRQMIGTPAYMSPEQAEMSGLDIDTRSDVYSLGVLLYELLTGTTPFDTRSLLESGYAEMLRAIREDEPHKPSTRISSLGDTGTRTAQQRRVELKKLTLLLRGDLDWIVMKCLEKDRTRRYDTANGLAADIRRHLNDEPVSAGAPSAGYKLRKFVKRNRLKVIAAGLVLAALLAAVVGTSWGLVEQSRARSASLQRELEDEQRSTAESARRSRNAEAVGALLGQCEGALRSGDAAKARIALDAARKRSAEMGAENQSERLERVSADLEFATELDAIDQYRWTWNRNSFGNPQVAATRAREALRRYGADPQAVSLEAAAARIEASAIRERIVLVLDLLLGGDDAQALRAVLRRVDPERYRDAYRDAVLAHDQGKVLELARDPAALEQPPEFAAALGRSLAIPAERRRVLLELAAVRRPSDISLLMILQSLSGDEQNLPGPDHVRWLQAAIAADPRNSAAYTNLGHALKQAGEDAASDACFRIAVANDPQNAVSQNSLGGVLKREGRLDEAIACFRKSIELDPTESMVFTNLGDVLALQGHADEAIETFRKAIEVGPNDAYAHGVLGDRLRDKGQIDEAIACYRKAIELDPKWGQPLSCLGAMLQKKGRLEEAIACLRKGIELDPRAAWQHGNLGNALRAGGQLDEAIACFRKAIELDPAYNAYGALGDALRVKGRIQEAIVNYEKSTELDPHDVVGYSLLAKVLVGQGEVDRAIAWARKGVEIAPNSAVTQIALGIALNADGQVDAAIDCFREAIDLDPNDAEAYHGLGAMMFNCGNAAEAVTHYRRAVELAPQNALYCFHLALTLQAVGEHDAALEAFRQTIELEPGNALAMSNLGAELSAKHRLDEAVSWCRKALEADPQLADAHCNLGSALAQQGRYAESLPSYRRGHELGSKRPDWRYPSAEWVRKAELRVAIEAKLADLLGGNLPFADDAERLECAQMCQVKKLFHAAARLYTEAFAADPRLAEDLRSWNRYNAAACAALAAAGGGEDGAHLDERERTRLRQQALDWLRSDLALHTSRLESGKSEDRAAVLGALREWQKDSDLACIRDGAALAGLPEEQRGAFLRLWTDVAAVLSNAETKGPR